MWQILYASFCEFNKLFNSGISLNCSISDVVTTRNTSAHFLGPPCTECSDQNPQPESDVVLVGLSFGNNFKKYATSNLRRCLC